MSPKEKAPDRVIVVGGKEFRIYKYFDESLGEELLNFPDFDENPEYTDDGRPFKMAIQECCPSAKPLNVEYTDPGDCSGCVWFQLDNIVDAIGICMCEELRRTQNPKEKTK